MCIQGRRGLTAASYADLDPSTSPIKNAVKGLEHDDVLCLGLVYEAR